LPKKIYKDVSVKKSLLAIAVLASIAGVANAQSSVVVYGIVDAGVTAERGGANGSMTKVATGVQQGNRLGFKGVEDLGNGLKALFQLESGFNLDTGTSRQGALFGRQAFVGLSSNIGTVTLGRQYNLIFDSLDAIDPFNTGLSGAASNLMAPGNRIQKDPATSVVGNGNVRTNNSVVYATPSFSGFSAKAMYGAGEAAGSSSTGRTLGASANYVNGPVTVIAAYDKRNAGVVAPLADLKLALIGATYDFGVAKVHAIAQTEKSDTDASNYRNYLLGVSAPVGTGTALASFIDRTDRNSTASGSKQYAIGYIHPLSKRTNFYTSYAHINNERNAQNVVGDASNGGETSIPSLGNSSSAVSVGIRHKF
jgi:predicted porin